MALVRVREHVNPLSQKYQTPIHPPAWPQIYAQPHRPLHLDIGCGRGQFLLSLAPLQPDWNYLGLEIRQSLVDQVNAQVQGQGYTNLHYLFCNANNSLNPLLRSLPEGILHRVTIQFPDPWFKRRHQKRRVVQPELVAEVATYLVPGGLVFVQSDIEEVAVEMRDRFQEHPAFTLHHAEPWLGENPLPIATERERSVLERNLPVYRALFIKQT